MHEYANLPFGSVFLPKVFIKTYYDRSFRMEFHAHDSIELIYLVTGKISVVQPDGTTANVGAGQFVLVLHGCYHRVVAESDDIELLVLELAAPSDKPTLESYIADSAEFGRYRSLQNIMQSPAGVLLFSDTDNVRHTLLHILEILNAHANETQDEFFELDYEVSIKQLLLAICRCRTTHLDISNNRYINRAMEYIRAHYAEPITAESVADYIGVSLSYAQKLFRTTIGMAIMNTVRFYRMRQCEYLLAMTDSPLIAIARKTGFGTQNNLYRHFRAKHGCSPSEYREHIDRTSFYNFDVHDMARILPNHLFEEEINKFSRRTS